MYRTIYDYMSHHFYAVCITVLLVLMGLKLMNIYWKKKRVITVIWWLVLGIYLLGVLFLTLGSRIHLQRRYLDLQIHWQYIVLALKGNARLVWEDAANVVLFLPLGMLFREIFNRKYCIFKCIIAGIILSTFIELMQFAMRCGYCDINDFICNVLGVAIGYFLGYLMDTMFQIIGRAFHENQRRD